MNAEIRKTPLFGQHEALGAKMVPFAGYFMPLSYTGILDEHRAVRNAAGIFDVSHMGEIEIKGRRALTFCQRIAVNDASRLKPGKVQYSAILNEGGGVLDDCTLYRLAEDHFLFVVNASRRDVVAKWFADNAMDGVSIEDRSDEYALIAVQGGKSEALLSRLTKRDLATVGYYEFSWFEVASSAALISRTGYTGEDGFEIYLPSAKGAEVWEWLIRTGEAEGLRPVGLGARDTLRLEQGYLLYGNDMDETVTPLEAGIGWAVSMDKGAFIGRDVLTAQKEKGLSRRLRAFRVSGKGIPRPGYEVRKADQRIGAVTSGTYSPSLDAGIGLGLFDAGVKQEDEITISIRGREVPARIVKPPFVKGTIKRK